MSEQVKQKIKSVRKWFALDDELRVSVRLIELGMSEYQKMIGKPKDYYPSFTLLASGLERLFKVYICFIEYNKAGELIGGNYIKNKNHKLEKSLVELLPHIAAYYEENFQRCSGLMYKNLENDISFLKEDWFQKNLIKFLSDFGGGARYTNFNIITEEKNSEYRSLDTMWEKLSTQLLYEVEGWEELIVQKQGKIVIDTYIAKRVTATIEKIVRAFARQLKFKAFGDIGLRYSNILDDFYKMEDFQLGTKIYS